MNRLLIASVAFALVTSASAQTPPVWRVTEELRIGSDAGPSSFNNIVGIAATKTGNIFVLDYKTQELRVFDARGQFLRLAARKGKGPGEITNANGLAIAPDGTIWVNDPASARFSIYSPDGRFARQLLTKMWGHSNPWGAVFDGNGRLVERFGIPSGPRTMTAHYRRISQDGSRIDTLRLPSCYKQWKSSAPFVARSADGVPGVYRNVPFQPQVLYILDSRGSQWCTPGDEYVIYNSDLDRSDTIAVIRSTAPRPPVTAAERAAVIAQVESLFAKFPTKDVDYSRIPAVKPAISAIFADNAGRLWVQRTPSSSGPSEFDVWDSSGRQIATARLNFRVKMDIVPVVVGNYLYAVTTDEDDVQYVVRAKISP